MVRPRRAHPGPRHPVRQRQPDRVAQVGRLKFHAPAQGRQRARGFQDRQIPPVPRDPEGVVHFRHGVHEMLSDVHPPQAGARVAHHGPQLLVLAVPLLLEPRVLPLEQQNALHDRLPEPDVALPGNLDAQPEPVQQLRAELPLFRVHRTHQQEPRRVAVAHSLAHHDVHARHRHIQKDVHHVVVQKVHLVDVQHVPVRLPQERPSRTSGSPPAAPPPGPGSPPRGPPTRSARGPQPPPDATRTAAPPPTPPGHGTRRTTTSPGRSRTGTPSPRPSEGGPPRTNEPPSSSPSPSPRAAAPPRSTGPPRSPGAPSSEAPDPPTR